MGTGKNKKGGRSRRRSVVEIPTAAGAAITAQRETLTMRMWSKQAGHFITRKLSQREAARRTKQLAREDPARYSGFSNQTLGEIELQGASRLRRIKDPKVITALVEVIFEGKSALFTAATGVDYLDPSREEGAVPLYREGDGRENERASVPPGLEADFLFEATSDIMADRFYAGERVGCCHIEHPTEYLGRIVVVELPNRTLTVAWAELRGGFRQGKNRLNFSPGASIIGYVKWTSPELAASPQGRLLPSAA